MYRTPIQICKLITSKADICRGGIIGCAVTLSASDQDTELNNGIALTMVKRIGEEQAVLCDIDDMQNMVRSWNDTYFIVSYNDERYPPLHADDKVLALYRNNDASFTTVYYVATILEFVNDDIRVQFDEDHTDLVLPRNVMVANTIVPSVIRMIRYPADALYRTPVQNTLKRKLTVTDLLPTTKRQKVSPNTVNQKPLKTQQQLLKECKTKNMMLKKTIQSLMKEIDKLEEEKVDIITEYKIELHEKDEEIQRKQEQIDELCHK
eukprot:250286_1